MIKHGIGWKPRHLQRIDNDAVSAKMRLFIGPSR